MLTTLAHGHHLAAGEGYLLPFLKRYPDHGWGRDARYPAFSLRGSDLASAASPELLK